MKQIQELIKLATENPELEVVVQVSQDVFCSDEYAWYLGELGRCSVDFIYQDDDQYFVGESDIGERIYERLDEEEGWEEDRLQKETDIEFKRLVDNGEIKKKLIVFVGV